MSFIKTNNLSKIYGNGNGAVQALKECSMEFESGEFTAIIGTSGSGKSTLLNLLGGLDTASKGEIFYGNENILTLSDKDLSEFRRKKIGFVFQFFNLIPELTAKENILLPFMIDKRKIDNNYFEYITKILGISDRLEHYPAQLSGGQKQRTAIARALILKPMVLLCDEPTGNLDSKSGNEVMELLQEMRKKINLTIIMVTHDKNIASMADKIIVISDGKIQ